ncbi:RGS domain-containing protein, partial [Neohortaea acidophila]
RRPNLREILANTSEAPWTLAAFMAYLSSNHCLETLEFTMDADRYKQHYMKMMANAGPTGVPSPKDRDFVQELWERLVEAYIRPSGSREVNIPSNVRDPILRKRPDELPPAPETLDPAVDKIHELMDESLLVPFLNSVYPHSGSPTTGSRPFNASQESITRLSQSHDDRQHRARDASTRNSSPPYAAAEQTGSRSYSPTSNLHRKSTPTSSSARQRRLTEAISENSTSAYPGMTDDSGDSPMHDSPTTPPTSPPLSDLNHPLG